MRFKAFLTFSAIIALTASSAHAATLAISIGIRETGNVQPKFANGGSTGGIEWIDIDGQSLNLDGTWKLFTFFPSIDEPAPFAGATANGVLDVDWGVLEHIRILNDTGVTQPIRLWIDNVTNTDSAGAAVEGFETFATGVEAMFQEPGFSGSTSANILAAGDISQVTNSMAFAGSQSIQVDFQFVDATETRWVRLTTSGTANVPNPAVHLRETGVFPTISFYMKGVAVPEPATLGMSAFALVGGLLLRRKSC